MGNQSSSGYDDDDGSILTTEDLHRAYNSTHPNPVQSSDWRYQPDPIKAFIKQHQNEIFKK